MKGAYRILNGEAYRLADQNDTNVSMKIRDISYDEDKALQFLFF